jgi:hypothetical protein
MCAGSQAAPAPGRAAGPTANIEANGEDMQMASFFDRTRFARRLRIGVGIGIDACRASSRTADPTPPWGRPNLSGIRSFISLSADFLARRSCNRLRPLRSRKAAYTALACGVCPTLPEGSCRPSCSPKAKRRQECMNQEWCGARRSLQRAFPPAPGEAAWMAIHGWPAAVVVAGIATRRRRWGAADVRRFAIVWNDLLCGESHTKPGVFAFHLPLPGPLPSALIRAIRCLLKP